MCVSVLQVLGVIVRGGETLSKTAEWWRQSAVQDRTTQEADACWELGFIPRGIMLLWAAAVPLPMTVLRSYAAGIPEEEPQ